MKIKQIALLGSGVWATALSQAIDPSIKIRMFSIEPGVIESIQKKSVHPRFPDIQLSSNLFISEDLDWVLEGSQLVIESLTSEGFKERIKELPRSLPLLITSKGILPSGETLFEVARAAKIQDVAVLSGGTLAEEVMRKMFSAATIASKSCAKLFIPLFDSRFFFIQEGYEPVACGIGGAFKNVVAILSGVLQGLGYGWNARAALIAKAFQEMKSYGALKGIPGEAFEGFSGLSDLVLTSSSEKSRNFQCGLLLARGISVPEMFKEVGMVVEGAFAAKAFYKIDPKELTRATYRLLYEGSSPATIIEELFY